MNCEHCIRDTCHGKCPTREDVAECAACGELIKADETICYCLSPEDQLSRLLDTDKFKIEFVGDLGGYRRGSTLCAACADKIRKGDLI